MVDIISFTQRPGWDSVSGQQTMSLYLCSSGSNVRADVLALEGHWVSSKSSSLSETTEFQGGMEDKSISPIIRPLGKSNFLHHIWLLLRFDCVFWMCNFWAHLSTTSATSSSSSRVTVSAAPPPGLGRFCEALWRMEGCCCCWPRCANMFWKFKSLN